MTDKPTPEARTFFAETRFQRMARRPGGVSRKQAIEQAQAQVDDLKTEFPDWLEREFAELVTSLRNLEFNPGDMQQLQTAHRSCSQMRDVGSTMGYDLVTFVSDMLCEHLDAIQAGAAYHKETVDCHIDALLLAKKDQYRNLRPDQLPEMTSGLRRVVERASAFLDKKPK